MATPYVKVSRRGRHSWEVMVIDGPMQYGPNGGSWIVFGSRDRAERKAGRKLRRYRRKLAAHEQFEVH